MLTKEEFINFAKKIEVYIQTSPDYVSCIQHGYFSDRFINAYKDYLLTSPNKKLSEMKKRDD